MASQRDKARSFEALHRGKSAFVLPNPWDIGSARMLANANFRALATSSVAYANTLGRGDYSLTLDQALAHCRDIVQATDLPVAADFENGFADQPDAVAENVARAIETGLVGCSIEDMTRDPSDPIYPFEMSVARIAAAVKSARRSGFPFLITARAENFLAGRKDMDDTIRRLQAYEKAGADVVYATGLSSIDQVRQIVNAVHVPVNVMAAKAFTVAELNAAGAKRISLGPWFARAAVAGFLAAVQEVSERGSFGFIANCPTGADIKKAMG